MDSYIFIKVMIQDKENNVHGKTLIRTLEKKKYS